MEHVGYGLYIELYAMGMFVYTTAAGTGIWTCHAFIFNTKKMPQRTCLLFNQKKKVRECSDEQATQNLRKEQTIKS